MSKYDDFDAALLGAIRNGADTLAPMCGNAKLKKLAEPHRLKDRWGALTPLYRVIDRRLQALRKKSVIAYSGGRWIVLDQAGKPIGTAA